MYRPSNSMSSVDMPSRNSWILSVSQSYWVPQWTVPVSTGDFIMMFIYKYNQTKFYLREKRTPGNAMATETRMCFSGDLVQRSTFVCSYHKRFHSLNPSISRNEARLRSASIDRCLKAKQKQNKLQQNKNNCPASTHKTMRKTRFYA